MGIRENVSAGITDEHRVSELGRLFTFGQITRRQYDNGVEFGVTILDYLKTIDAPSPYGGRLDEISDDECLRCKIEMARAREKLNRAGRRSAQIVDRVAVYGEPISGSTELKLLQAGLDALSR